MEVFKRIDSVIITESNKEYLGIYKIIKFYLKACFCWLCFRTGALLVILFSLRINKDLAFQEGLKDVVPVLSSVTFIDTVFLFVLFLILLAIFYTAVINAIVKPKKR